MFVVEAVRILALQHGIRETSTLKRISQLVTSGCIHPDDGEYFEAAYHLLLHLALKSQIDSVSKKEPIDAFINPDNLSQRDRETLRQAFKAITALQEVVSAEFGELIL